jgi:hypothetical protein
MSRSAIAIMAILLLLGVAAAGYWFGTLSVSTKMQAQGTPATARKILYYRNPMGLPDTAPHPN